MNRKTLTFAGVAFAMTLGLSACGGDDAAENAAQQSEEASQNSQDMGTGGGDTQMDQDITTDSMDDPSDTDEPLPSAEPAMADDIPGQMSDDTGSSMNGMNEDGMDRDPAAAAREGETGGNVNSSGAMSQAEEAEQLNNPDINTQ